MGHFYVCFACHHCNHCCTEVVCLPTPWDVVQIVKYTGRNPRTFLEFLTPDEIEGVAKNDPTWLQVNGEKYIMALKRDTVNGCFFLDRKTRHCTIYPARPLLCRLYPFRLHETRDGRFKAFSLHDDVGCPRFRDAKVPTQPLYEIFVQDREHQYDYHELVRAFNAKAYRGKKPEDFIDMFVEVRSPEKSVSGRSRSKGANRTGE